MEVEAGRLLTFVASGAVKSKVIDIFKPGQRQRGSGGKFLPGVSTLEKPVRYHNSATILTPGCRDCGLLMVI